VASFREQLCELGWKQGGIIEAGSISNEILDASGVEAFLILNQTCDLIHEKTTTEPYAELLPLRRINCLDPTYEGGKNSRKIHMHAILDGGTVCVEGTITDRVMLPREKLLETKPSDRWQISSGTLNGTLVWFTRRFLRTAFPDRFENRLKPLLKGISEIITPNHLLIDTLFLHIHSHGELPDNEPYEIRILIAARKADLDDQIKLEALHAMAKELGSIFENASGFELQSPVIVESLNKISLAQQRDYLVWERYDYLSFGEGE
jgi:hypothetical protein